MSKTKKSNNTKNNSSLDQLELFRDGDTFKGDDNQSRDFEDNNLVIDYVDKKNTSQFCSDKVSNLENGVSEQNSPQLLSLPDRFESLKNSSTQQIQNIIIPVENALAHFDDTYVDIRSSGRGAFWILRGQTGSGKSTFLNTIHLFREGVESFSILAHDSIPCYLSQFTANNDKKLSVLVIEGREARKDISDESLESDLHAINGFIRALSGRLTLVVWQCNTDDLENRLINLSKNIGGSSLVGIDSPSYKFNGISKDRYYDVANLTISTLNEGASFTSFGVSEKLANDLVDKSDTIGDYLARIRKVLTQNKAAISSLLVKERCRVWTLVIAANEPDKDVASLTRGTASVADIDRLLVSTNANIVKELKHYPEKMGILATMLDARIIHLPISTALSIVRQFADDNLRNLMQERQMEIKESNKTKKSIEVSDLARAFRSRSLEPNRNKGSGIGSNTKVAFSKLMLIAQTKDEMVNRAIGESLKNCRIIRDFEIEYPFKGELDLKTDLFCITENNENIRLEIMWRTKASRADIAIYVLNKLRNYGKAIGYLD